MIGLRFTELSNIIIETIVCQRQLGLDVGGPLSVADWARTMDYRINGSFGFAVNRAGARHQALLPSLGRLPLMTAQRNSGPACGN